MPAATKHPAGRALRQGRGTLTGVGPIVGQGPLDAVHAALDRMLVKEAGFRIVLMIARGG
jgi:hypothetical protein